MFLLFWNVFYLKVHLQANKSILTKTTVFVCYIQLHNVNALGKA